MSMSLTALAVEILAALARRDISALELTRATLGRIDAINTDLNAVVTLDAEAAIAQAKASDDRRKRGQAGVLDGLPITIKDAYDVAGMISTAGLPAYSTRRPEQDSAAVARLRRAGAIIMGKTNVPVFSGDFQTSNPLYGMTRNAWDLARTPGGSSGGAVTAVSTGMSAFELGSDLGGSIRWPCHASGVFGLKTTWGLVSTWGHIPPLPDRRPARNVDLMCAGPITRSAADLDLVLSVIAGPREQSLMAPSLRAPRRLTPHGLRIALWAEDPFASADAQISAGVRHAADLLKNAGAIVDETARPAFRFAEAYEVYALINHAVVAASLPARVRAKLQAAARTVTRDDLSHRALQARGAALNPSQYHLLNMRRMVLQRQWADFFTRWDIVLCPPAPVLAIAHDALPDIHARQLIINGKAHPYLDFLIWASLASGAGLPAACAPVRHSIEGLPIGVQIIAAEGDDRTAIAVAGMIESLGGGYKPPPILQR
jgi:amidase